MLIYPLSRVCHDPEARLGREMGRRVSTQLQPLSPPSCCPHPLPWFRQDTPAPVAGVSPAVHHYLAVRMLAPGEAMPWPGFPGSDYP